MPSRFSRERMNELQHKFMQRQRSFQLEMADVDLINLSQRLFEQKRISRRRISLAEANQVKQNLSKDIHQYLKEGQLMPEQIRIAKEILALCGKRTTGMNLIDIYRKTCVLKY